MPLRYFDSQTPIDPESLYNSEYIQKCVEHWGKTDFNKLIKCVDMELQNKIANTTGPRVFMKTVILFENLQNIADLFAEALIGTSVYPDGSLESEIVGRCCGLVTMYVISLQPEEWYAKSELTDRVSKIDGKAVNTVDYFCSKKT